MEFKTVLEKLISDLDQARVRFGLKVQAMANNPDRREQDLTGREFEIVRENSKRIAKRLTLEERIEFITFINAMHGHRKRKHVPITGDRFLM